MLVRRDGRNPRQNRRLARWPRWVQAWRDDRAQRATVRATARAHAPLRPGERLLAVACGAGGEVLAATDQALHQQAGQAWARLGWDQVGRVGWDEQRHILLVTSLTPAVPARTVLRLAKDWGLPTVAAERVRWATLVDQRISLNGPAGARVLARRIPSGAGVTWLVILDHGLDPADPAIKAGLQSALTELRVVTGVEDAAGAEPGNAQPW
jgi:hypothetical protein